jgi:hypothetical protein
MNERKTFAWLVGLMLAAGVCVYALHAQERVMSDAERLSALELRLAKLESLVFPQISQTTVSSPAITAAAAMRTLKVEAVPEPVWTNTMPPRITPKSRFIDDCPYCGCSNILSSSLNSSSVIATPNGTQVEWSASWKCPHCEGQWSDTKTSFIPKRKSRLSTDALAPR